MGNFNNIVLITVFALATSACGGGGGGGGTSERVVDFSACDTKPNVGASALSGNSGKTEWVVSDFFGKSYDRFDLEAVANASSTSTTEYIRSLGITLFKVPRGGENKQCPTYFNLAAAQGPYQQIWEKASGENSGNGGSLAGLFFEFCGPGTGASCRPRAVVQPTILVDEVSDRWTIVHELMHYNFNQALKADHSKPTTIELDNEMRRLTKSFEKATADFKDLPNRQDLELMATTLRATITLGRETFVRKALEEVAIEGLLIDEWSQGRLGNVSLNSAKSGIWYMKQSRDKFLQSLQPYGPMIAKIKATADENFWDDVIKVAEETRADLESYRKEVNEVILAAEKKVGVAEEDARSSDTELAGRWAFSSSGLLEAFDEAATPNLVQDHELMKFEKHLESHDHDGLQKSFDSNTKEIESILQSAF